MSDRATCAVVIRGQEFRIRSDEDPAALQRIAETVDATMTRIEQRTGTIDTLDVAMLTALNLARELVEVREHAGPRVGDDRLRDLILRAESAVTASDSA